MTTRLEPRAESTCRLCRVGQATVRFTDDPNVIDVACPKCGQFRIEIPGYHIDLNGLTGDQRLKLVAFVEAKHGAGETSPLITRELLVEVVGENGNGANGDADSGSEAPTLEDTNRTN